MRRHTGAALAAAGVLLAGCSGDPADTATTDGAAPTSFATAAVTATALPERTTPAPTTTTATATATVAPTASGVPAKGSTDFGYFTKVLDVGAQPKLQFDRAQFLTGEAAQKAAKAHGDTAENDYYVVNDSKVLRTLVFSAACEVVGSTALNSYAGDEGVDPKPRTLDELVGFVGTEQGRATGFHLVYGDRGLVVRAEEQYVP